MANNQFTFKSAAERFMHWVEVQPNGCWYWTGSVRGGYGRFKTGPKTGGKNWQAHRWAYEYFIKPVPASLFLDHTCHNKEECKGGYGCPHRRCVNPAHLEPVTGLENTRRGNSGRTQSARTHCPAGHPYDAENTMLIARYGKGQPGPKMRYCRECSRSRTREWRKNLSK